HDTNPFRGWTLGHFITLGTQLCRNRICIGFIGCQCNLHHPLLVTFTFQQFTCLLSFCFLFGVFCCLFLGFFILTFVFGFTFSFFLLGCLTLFLSLTFCLSRLTFCFGFLLLLQFTFFFSRFAFSGFTLRFFLGRFS